MKVKEKCQQTNAENKRLLIIDDKCKREILTIVNRRNDVIRIREDAKLIVFKKINKRTDVDDDVLMSILLKTFVAAKNWMRLTFAKCFD